jgi:hypothetical protein
VPYEVQISRGWAWIPCVDVPVCLKLYRAPKRESLNLNMMRRGHQAAHCS